MGDASIDDVVLDFNDDDGRAACHGVMTNTDGDGTESLDTVVDNSANRMCLMRFYLGTVSGLEPAAIYTITSWIEDCEQSHVVCDCSHATKSGTKDADSDSIENRRGNTDGTNGGTKVSGKSRGGAWRRMLPTKKNGDISDGDATSAATTMSPSSQMYEKNLAVTTAHGSELNIFAGCDIVDTVGLDELAHHSSSMIQQLRVTRERMAASDACLRIQVHRHRTAGKGSSSMMGILRGSKAHKVTLIAEKRIGICEISGFTKTEAGDITLLGKKSGRSSGAFMTPYAVEIGTSSMPTDANDSVADGSTSAEKRAGESLRILIACRGDDTSVSTTPHAEPTTREPVDASRTGQSSGTQSLLTRVLTGSKVLLSRTTGRNGIHTKPTESSGPEDTRTDEKEASASSQRVRHIDVPLDDSNRAWTEEETRKRKSSPLPRTMPPTPADTSPTEAEANRQSAEACGSQSSGTQPCGDTAMSRADADFSVGGGEPSTMEASASSTASDNTRPTHRRHLSWQRKTAKRFRRWLSWSKGDYSAHIDMNALGDIDGDCDENAHGEERERKLSSANSETMSSSSERSHDETDAVRDDAITAESAMQMSSPEKAERYKDCHRHIRLELRVNISPDSSDAEGSYLEKEVDVRMCVTDIIDADLDDMLADDEMNRALRLSLQHYDEDRHCLTRKSSSDQRFDEMLSSVTRVTESEANIMKTLTRGEWHSEYELMHPDSAHCDDLGNAFCPHSISGLGVYIGHTDQRAVGGNACAVLALFVANAIFDASDFEHHGHNGPSASLTARNEHFIAFLTRNDHISDLVRTGSAMWSRLFEMEVESCCSDRNAADEVNAEYDSDARHHATDGDRKCAPSDRAHRRRQLASELTREYPDRCLDIDAAVRALHEYGDVFAKPLTVCRDGSHVAFVRAPTASKTGIAHEATAEPDSKLQMLLEGTLNLDDMIAEIEKEYKKEIVTDGDATVLVYILSWNGHHKYAFPFPSILSS